MAWTMDTHELAWAAGLYCRECQLSYERDYRRRHAGPEFLAAGAERQRAYRARKKEGGLV